MKENILKFEMHDSFAEKIQPIKKQVPEWYKNSERFFGGTDKLDPTIFEKHSLKLCAPFLDSLTSGYYVPLIQDLIVNQTEFGPQISWREKDIEVLSERPKEGNRTLPTPAGHSETHFVWKLRFSLETPKGYSFLLTHPLNRYDLPFTTLSGIVDAEMVIGPGNLPVFFKNDFEGIIPQGTPIAQIIPFKREDWIAKETFGVHKIGQENTKRSGLKLFGWYKDNHWHRKNYN